MLKAKLDSRKGAWAEELPGILWAYRTMARTLTRETPFSFAYDIEAMVYVEMGVHAYRVSNHDSKQNNADLSTNLDLLEDKRNEASIGNDNYQRWVERYYNACVKRKRFSVGNLVL